MGISGYCGHRMWADFSGRLANAVLLEDHIMFSRVGWQEGIRTIRNEEVTLIIRSLGYVKYYIEVLKMLYFASLEIIIWTTKNKWYWHIVKEGLKF